MEQYIAEQFGQLRQQYHRQIQDAGLWTRIKAFVMYGYASLKLFWNNTTGKEKFVIVSRIIEEIIYRLMQILIGLSILAGFIYVLINLILFIGFTFNLFSDSTYDFLMKVLPSGLLPTQRPMIGAVRVLVCGLYLLIMTHLTCFSLDNMSFYRDNVSLDSSWWKKLGWGLLFILVFSVIIAVIIGLIYLLCFYMNVPLWDKITKYAIVITVIVGFLWALCVGQSGSDEIIYLAIPKSLLDR